MLGKLQIGQNTELFQVFISKRPIMPPGQRPDCFSYRAAHNLLYQSLKAGLETVSTISNKFERLKGCRSQILPLLSPDMPPNFSTSALPVSRLHGRHS
jgi:hypothetical protein